MSISPRRKYVTEQIDEVGAGLNYHIEGVMKIRKLFNGKNRRQSSCDSSRTVNGVLKPILLTSEQSVQYEKNS